MIRDDLEAAIWDAIRRHGVTTATPAEFAYEILCCADAWAAGDSEDITLRRRQVLARESAAVYGGHARDDHLQLPRLRRGPDR